MFGRALRTPSRNLLALKYDIWWQHSGPTVVETYAKPLVHYWRKLIVPRYRLNGFGRRRFAVAGTSTWNSLPDSRRDPELSLNTFKRQLKTDFLPDIDDETY